MVDDDVAEPFGSDGAIPDGLLFLYMGLVDDVDDESFGDPFGLKVKPLSDAPTISIGRKH